MFESAKTRETLTNRNMVTISDKQNTDDDSEEESDDVGGDLE